MSKPKFQNPTGVHDILPEDQPYYEAVAEGAKSVLSFYQFKKIDTPGFTFSSCLNFCSNF